MTTASAFLSFGIAAAAQVDFPAVEAAAKPGEPWHVLKVRTLEQLPVCVREAKPVASSKYGGWKDRQFATTGYFYTTNLNGRWWFVDPEGCLFLQAGLASVKMIPTLAARDALQKKFGSKEGWAQSVVDQLHHAGFNGLGAWSDADLLRSVTNQLPYTRIWSFMSAYAKHRGGSFQQPGHTGYPKDCIFVFDPEFEKFCNDHARQLVAGKNDPWLIGHFSDNEMPLKRDTLTNMLSLPPTDAAYVAARQFMVNRHGPQASFNDVTLRDEQDFLELVVSRYFKIVSGAIKQYDPNHLFLGARFYGSDLRCPEIFRAAGPYVDVISVNWYRVWTPDAAKLAMWTKESGKPTLITEWYAKGVDSGMANTGGAGWLVKTQRERGVFYEHFALGLLESPYCVGWHWFRYSDNDPADTTVDPSNRDSNKGIVDNRYDPYTPLVFSMTQINTRIYPLAAYFGSQVSAVEQK